MLTAKQQAVCDLLCSPRKFRVRVWKPVQRDSPWSKNSWTSMEYSSCKYFALPEEAVEYASSLEGCEVKIDAVTRGKFNGKVSELNADS